MTKKTKNLPAEINFLFCLNIEMRSDPIKWNTDIFWPMTYMNHKKCTNTRMCIPKIVRRKLAKELNNAIHKFYLSNCESHPNETFSYSILNLNPYAMLDDVRISNSSETEDYIQEKSI